MICGGTPLRAVINTAAGSTVALIAGVSGKTTRVFAVHLTLAAGTLTFKQGSTALTGAMTFSSLSLDPARDDSGMLIPHFVCASGADFNLTFSGANQCSGYALYTQETDG